MQMVACRMSRTARVSDYLALLNLSTIGNSKTRIPIIISEMGIIRSIAATVSDPQVVAITAIVKVTVVYGASKHCCEFSTVRQSEVYGKLIFARVVAAVIRIPTDVVAWIR